MAEDVLLGRERCDFIVGRCFKQWHADYGDVCGEYVREFMQQHRALLIPNSI